jgi:hypothetical protein
MKVKLFAQNESKGFKATAHDKRGRKTTVTIHADTVKGAKDRVSDSMADYGWVGVSAIEPHQEY